MATQSISRISQFSAHEERSMTSTTQTISTPKLWTARIISALVVLFLLVKQKASMRLEINPTTSTLWFLQGFSCFFK